MSFPLWLQCTHLLMIMHHVTKLKSSQTGFLNMTMSSLYSNDLHSHQISIQQSTFGMWWNERFTSWMCRRQICSNCVMLSYQYGPKSLRNVSNILLNLCHEELRQFWRQKGVQPGTSKVYLIKWPVSVCIYIYIYMWATKAVISSTAIFAAISNNTLYGSKWSIFLLCQKS